MRFDKNAFDCLIEVAGKVAEGDIDGKSKEKFENALKELGMGERKPRASVVFGRPCPTNKGEDPSLGL